MEQNLVVKYRVNDELIEKKLSYTTGTTYLDFIRTHFKQNEVQSFLAAGYNDQIYDLQSKPLDDAFSQVVNLYTFEDKQGKYAFWHSTAHVMAIAVLELWPEVKLTIGPAIDQGFYYDFEKAEPFSPEDFDKIEKKMYEVVKRKLGFEKEIISYEQATKMFADNKYKIELVEEYKNDELSVYKTGDFVDLCRGPHIWSTSLISAFKVLRTGGAYWRGDSNNAQLQRLYGISFPDKQQLKDYVTMMEEAAKRSHTIVGEQLGLFTIFDKVGKGLPIWLPKGEIIKREIEKLAVEMEQKYGYVRVSTPFIAKKELFETSGHLPYYKDSMFPSMKMDDGEYYLKAMNCPMHHLIFSHTTRSYRDLPLRLAEYGVCHRNELSGALSGLQRVRSMCTNDAHMYCRKDQIESEIQAVIEMIQAYYGIFGFSDYWFRLSLSDLSANGKYIDQPENWAYAEEVLRKVLLKMNVKFVEAKDEAAFYGPKIDVQFKNVYGKDDTMSTVQLDFAAKERFGLTYIDQSGAKNNDVFVIHRAPLSTHERFMAFLIELYAGKFPLWLSPEQVRVLPIADRHVEFAQEVAKQFEQNDLRVTVDDDHATINKKVRNAQKEYVNYILVIGDQELENKSVNVRTRDNIVHGEKKVDVLLRELKEEVKERRA